MKLRVHQFELPLRHPFSISRETITVQPTVIVELEHDGQQGYGEATANTYYGVSVAGLTDRLEASRDEIEAWDGSDPARFWQQLAPRLAEHPFAQCAVDQAAHDLWGKLSGRPVYQLWGLDPAAGPPSNYTIGIDRIEVMVAKMNEFADWPIYKIKLGTERDLEIVRALRAHTDAVFRVDANAAWSVAQTIELAPELKALGVEFIEQPLPADRWDEMIRIRQESVLPVIADESCIQERDVARCAECFHGINIKLSKCGGLTPARRMIDRARAEGLQVMVGCMTESTVGISAIAQLLPLLDYVDMDGASLLGQDIASGVRLDRGRCLYPALPGHGVTLLAP